jgi:transcription elongation factor
LGLVHSVDESSLTAEVHLVPRIPDRKRKRRSRPKPALFDATTVEATFGAGLVVKEKDGWLFKGNKFVNGLEVQNFELYELSDRSVNAAHDELELFHRTCDAWVEDAIVLSGGAVSLRVSDKIRVVAGPHVASTGVVVDIIGDIVKIQSDSFPDPQQVRRWEVCKRFDRGDFVHVVHGLDRGVEGFIIDMDEGVVTLCCRTIHEVSRSSLHSMICDAR